MENNKPSHEAMKINDRQAGRCIQTLLTVSIY